MGKSENHFALQLFSGKTAEKHTQYLRNDSILKIGHFAKAIRKRNGPWPFILGRNFKELKPYKNDSAITSQYFYANIG